MLHPILKRSRIPTLWQMYTGSTSNNSIGALIGRVYYNNVKSCFATGTVTSGANNYVGGLIGNASNSAISYCYFVDSQGTNGIWYRGTGCTVTACTQKTDLDFYKNITSYNTTSNWDSSYQWMFGGDYWNLSPSINNGFPYILVPATSLVTVPSSPLNVTAIAGDGQATVSFTVPTDNGGRTITGYVVTSSPGGITAQGTETSIIVTGLTNDTQYTFKVKAINEIGYGAESAASNAVTPRALYTVTYNANGATSGAVPIDTAKYNQGSTVIILNNTSNLQKTNYVFAGWNTQPDGSGVYYAPGTSFIVGSNNITFYAQWKIPFEIFASYSKENNVIYAPINVKNNSLSQASAATVVALYDSNNKLLNVKKYNDIYDSAQTNSFIYTHSNQNMNDAYFKIFVWNNLEQMRPLAIPFESR